MAAGSEVGTGTASRPPPLLGPRPSAILTDPSYRRALLSEGGPWRRAVLRLRLMPPLAQRLAARAPGLKIPLWSYLPWRDLIDVREGVRETERALVVDGYLKDPDFDRWYPLDAVVSLLATPPPGRIQDLRAPTMFIVASEGPTPRYVTDLFAQLPDIPPQARPCRGERLLDALPPRRGSRAARLMDRPGRQRAGPGPRWAGALTVRAARTRRDTTT